jgi:succinate dehydrogenase / fumarate reductase, cytochrome b subunit
LDAYQPEIRKLKEKGYDIPILHFPQLVSLALGHTPKELDMYKHIIGGERMMEKVYGLKYFNVLLT